MKKIPRTAKIGRGRRPSPIWLSEEFLNPIISKLDKRVVLLLINYIASQLYWALLSHRGYYTVARRYEFYLRVARIDFVSEIFRQYSPRHRRIISELKVVKGLLIGSISHFSIW